MGYIFASKAKSPPNKSRYAIYFIKNCRTDNIIFNKGVGFPYSPGELQAPVKYIVRSRSQEHLNRASYSWVEDIASFSTRVVWNSQGCRFWGLLGGGCHPKRIVSGTGAQNLLLHRCCDIVGSFVGSVWIQAPVAAASLKLSWVQVVVTPDKSKPFCECHQSVDF